MRKKNIEVVVKKKGGEIVTRTIRPNVTHAEAAGTPRVAAPIVKKPTRIVMKAGDSLNMLPIFVRRAFGGKRCTMKSKGFS